jgi:hypothetical protein
MGFGLMIGFIELFDTVHDYPLQLSLSLSLSLSHTHTLVFTFTSTLAVTQ